MFDKLEIGKYIDDELPKIRHHHISHGTAVNALTLNGLGYTESRLSQIPEFYTDRATERLLGAGIKPRDLNENGFKKKELIQTLPDPAKSVSGELTGMPDTIDTFSR